MAEQLGMDKATARQAYIDKRSGGIKKPVLSFKKPGKNKEYKLDWKRNRAQDQHNERMKDYNRQVAGIGNEWDAKSLTGGQDYSGRNFEKRYGSAAAESILSAHADGNTGLLSRYTESDAGDVTEHRFGDINEAAGRITDRREIKTKLAEGKYAAGGGTGLGASSSGGAGFNILASSSTAAKKKKKTGVGYTANDSNQLYNAAAMG